MSKNISRNSNRESNVSGKAFLSAANILNSKRTSNQAIPDHLRASGSKKLSITGNEHYLAIPLA